MNDKVRYPQEMKVENSYVETSATAPDLGTKMYF